MDPFNEVKDEAESTIKQLESIIAKRLLLNQPPSLEQIQDFENNLQEMRELQEDFRGTLEMSSAEPERFNLTPLDIRQRQNIINNFEKRISQLEQKWEKSKQRDPTREVTTMSNRISQDGENPFAAAATDFEDLDSGVAMTNYQQQEMIEEQDNQLDDIHKTMMNLNQQAAMMGDELEDQAFMLDELDYELDHTGNKLQRGMKRLNVFIERNKETASNWCIGILVVALVLLLVLLIVA